MKSVVKIIVAVIAVIAVIVAPIRRQSNEG
jgi:hypothetical protein